MVRSRIYLGRTTSIFGVHPTNRPDAIRRKPDSGGKNGQKSTFFDGFMNN